MSNCKPLLFAAIVAGVLIADTLDSSALAQEPETAAADNSRNYIIGPGDTLNVFVWRNPELTVTVPVRPDGKISTPLIEDMEALGKTPTELARDMEAKLAEYIRSPKVNIIVKTFVGAYSEQIKVVGEAANPRALSYRERMTVLDVIIEVGGLTEYASGNRAKIVRWEGEEQVEIKVRLKDLLNKGKISENILMKPGDVLVIPRSRF